MTTSHHVHIILTPWGGGIIPNDKWSKSTLGAVVGHELTQKHQDVHSFGYVAMRSRILWVDVSHQDHAHQRAFFISKFDIRDTKHFLSSVLQNHPRPVNYQFQQNLDYYKTRGADLMNKTR